ncbi:MAG: 7-carboxy-7-deazaguanine synthase QueE [Planctomycetaceae bacterium]
MRVAEVFDSIQGEGQFAGTPSSFVRLTGCNLRCWFCDTPYTSWQPEGSHQTWQELVSTVAGYSSSHIVVTGGEPLLQPDIVALTAGLKPLNRPITIETAGTVFRPVHADLMSISPKLANSTPRQQPWKGRHDATRHRPRVVRQLMESYPYQLKFVIDEQDDVDDVERYLAELQPLDSERVWLMPQARQTDELADKSGWVRQLAVQRGFRFSPRLHVERFGNARGK